MFVLVEDMTSKIFMYDGINFCKNLSLLQSGLNPLTKQPILDAHFYIIKKEQTLENLLKDEGTIPFLCDLSQYLDNKDQPYFNHVIALTDPDFKPSTKYFLEFQLAVDYHTGRGTGKDINLAANYAEQKAVEGNPFCQQLVAMYFCFGMGKVADQKRAEYWADKASDILLNTEMGKEKLSSDVMQEISRLFAPIINK